MIFNSSIPNKAFFNSFAFLLASLRPPDTLSILSEMLPMLLEISPTELLTLFIPL